MFLQQLALLAGFDLPSMGHNTVEYLHTVGECAKPAFADREAHYGDPQFVDAPQEPLLDPSYAESRREVVGEEASYALRPGTAGGRAPLLPDPTDVAEGGSAGAGEPTVPRDDQGTGDTCHLDVVDRHGNMVSATPSGGWLQSSPVVPGLGFPLGAWAEMFWLTAGLRARNHDVEVVDGWSLGRISAVSRDAADGSLRAAANPRGMQGYAVGR